MIVFGAVLLAATLSADLQKVEARFQGHESKRLVPMLQEVVRFPTDAGNEAGHRAQKEWLQKTAADLGLLLRDAGKVTEIELPGPQGAPVLGLVVHGDVQPVEEKAWSFPPFSGAVKDGYVLGRGSVDDKSGLVQALAVMKAIKGSGIRRTHTIRLLVGSEEESSAGEMEEYLKDHQAPDYSLVLDSEFPVVVGEKAWDGLALTTTLDERGNEKPYRVISIDAGLAASIVPDRAEIVLRWKEGTPDWRALLLHVKSARLPAGTSIDTGVDGKVLTITARGRSAHAGVNLTGGRNALVALARALEGQLSAGGANDLLAFAREAGKDIYGTGLKITDDDPIWGRYGVNVATIKRDEKEPAKYTLYINLRRTPPRTAAQIEAYLNAFVADFNQRTGASLVTGGGYFGDEPLGFDPKAPLVRRLMAAYSRATGEKNPKPAISGGGTYAKRLPNAIAFGTWFPGKPYPGHDVDEKMPIADLQRGARVVLHAIVDLATGPRVEKPFGK